LNGNKLTLVWLHLGGKGTRKKEEKKNPLMCLNVQRKVKEKKNLPDLLAKESKRNIYMMRYFLFKNIVAVYEKEDVYIKACP